MPASRTILKAAASLALLAAAHTHLPAALATFPAALPSGFETGFKLGDSPRFLSDSVFLSNQQVWDLATAQRLAGTDFHTPNIALIDYRPETDKRLYLLSGREDWTLLVNAVHDALVLLKDGPLQSIPFLGSPINLSDDATRVIFDNRINAYGNFLYLRDAITGDDLVSTNEFRSEKTPRPPNVYALSGDAKTLYTVADAGLIERWDVNAIEKTGEFSYSNIPFNGLALSRDERTLLAWSLFTRGDDFLIAFDTETGERRYSRLLENGFEFPGGTGLVGTTPAAIYATPDTQRLLIRSGPTTVLDFATGKSLAQLPLAPGSALASAYVQDRKRFVIAYASGLIEEREPSDFSLVDSSYHASLQGAYDTAIAPGNGHIFYTAGTTATVYDPDSKQTIWFKSDFGFQSRGATITTDASLVHIPAKGVYDFSQDRYAIETPYGSHRAFSSDGSLYAHAASDAIQVFHTATSELAYEYDVLSRTDALAFSPDNQALIAAGRTQDPQGTQVVLIEISLPTGDLQRLATLGSVRFFDSAATPQQIVVSQDRILVSTWRYTLFALDRNAPHSTPVSLPIGPISPQSYSIKEPRLAGIAPSGSFLYENGNGRLIGATVRTARFVPATLAPRSSGYPNLTFNAQSDRRYFLQTSNDLETWATQALATDEPLPLPPPALSTPVFARVVEIE